MYPKLSRTLEIALIQMCIARDTHQNCHHVSYRGRIPSFQLEKGFVFVSECVEYLYIGVNLRPRKKNSPVVYLDPWHIHSII